MQTKEKCWMEGTQTNVTREKRKSPFLSLSIYLLLPSLFLPASISVPSWRLCRFSSSCCSQIKMDASLCATEETHLELPACAIHSRPWDFSSLSFPCLLFFFSLLPFDLTLPLSRTNFIQKSLTQKHTFLRTHMQHRTIICHFVTNCYVWGVRMCSCSLCTCGQSSNPNKTSNK